MRPRHGFVDHGAWEHEGFADSAYSNFEFAKNAFNSESV